MMKRVFLISALCLLISSHALSFDYGRAVRDSVIYDAAPSYYKDELSRCVFRMMNQIGAGRFASPRHTLAAFVATTSILEIMQRKVQEIAPVPPDATNFWSGRPRTGWLVATEQTFDATSSLAYFSAISAREATAAQLEHLSHYWNQGLLVVALEYEILKSFMKSSIQRKMLYHRLVELKALHFIQDHSKALFEAAFAAALKDIGENKNAYPFNTRKAWAHFNEQYFQDLPNEALVFITPLLDAFELRAGR